jgi:hypothetical protein
LAGEVRAILAQRRMWRTLGLIVLFGLLLVSVGGNVVFLQSARGLSADADHLRQRALTAEQQANALQKQVDALAAANRQAPTSAAPASTTAMPTPAITGGSAPGLDQVTLQQMEGQVASIRGLQPRSNVLVRFLDQTALRRYFVDNFNRDYLPSEREADQKLETTLGLLGPGDNLVQILLDVLQEQVIGVYSEDDKVLYLVSDRAQLGTDEKTTFIHEYTHALQDQYFNLSVLAPKHPSNNDQAAAIQGLIEGDGSLVQGLWIREHLSQDEISRLGQGSGADSPALASAPPVVRAQLLFPYTAGFDFVRQIWQEQHGYAAVDDVFRKPPESTAQVLHPEKYLGGVRPVEVTLPDLARAMGPGWRQISSNVLGEFELRLATEQFTDATRAENATSGWAGDRWQLLEKDGRQALVVKTTWDSDEDARRFFDGYGLALSNRFAGAKSEAATDTRQALTATTNATELRLRGRDVLVVIGFDRPSAEALVAAVGGF